MDKEPEKQATKRDTNTAAGVERSKAEEQHDLDVKEVERNGAQDHGDNRDAGGSDFEEDQSDESRYYVFG